MKFFFEKKGIDVFKIVILSLVIFFWDLRIKGFDPRLLIISLLPFIFFGASKIELIKNKKNFFYFVLFFFLIVIHQYINLYIDNQNFNKIPKDLIYVLLCFVIVFVNLRIIRENLKLLIFFFIFCFVISTLVFFIINGYNYDFAISCTYLGGWHGYTRFFFSENSHLAMMSVAVIIFYLIGNDFLKLSISEKILLSLFLLIAFLNYTATFLVGIILGLAALFISNLGEFRRKEILLSVFLLSLSTFFIISDKECSSKIFKSQSAIVGLDKNLGLSGAVFVNSFNIAKTTLKDRPYGWGINRYEFAYKKYAIDQKDKFDLENYHPKLFEWNLNLKDGSNNFSKIITEFGFFSILIFFYFIYFSFSKKPNFNEKCFLVPLILTQLLRGAGYFNGGFLLCIILMIAISISNEND